MSLLPNHKSKFDKKLDKFFGVKLDGLDISVINTLADTCPAQLLPILAANFDVDIDKLSESTARELIKNAFEIHYYSGTFYSLNKALKLFYATTNVKEWYEYGGAPYHFKLELEVSKTGINQESLKKTDEIVNTYKNVRSVYDGVSIKIATKANAHAGGYLMHGETISVMPYVLRELETKTGFYHANTFKTHEIINIF
ncbi:phage tail protein I [Campylobacter sp. RM9328]|uniref:phage tail protein I n=1 Tax=Campylobacter sp. RM9328 TaxID=1705720 RepID=UPI0014727780|nr:phage tail protein I [Campylobacter sp. RM9328]